MNETITTFQFRKGFEVIHEMEGTFTQARKKGDELANEHGRVEMSAHNPSTNRWESLITFLGNRQAINCFGQPCIIDPDYRNMWTKE